MMTVEVLCKSQLEKEACIILNKKKERRPRFVISVVEGNNSEHYKSAQKSCMKY